MKSTGREYWVNMLARTARPVLESCAEGVLQNSVPQKDGNSARKYFVNLECVARVLSGIAPWLENAETGSSEEEALRETFAQLSRAAICNLVDAHSVNFGNFTSGNVPWKNWDLTQPFQVDIRQPVVDTAFLVQGILRAPVQLWQKLPQKTQKQVIEAVSSTKIHRCHRSNWLLFAAMVETFLYFATGECDTARIDYALASMENWYVGDSYYKDGAWFAHDYYNSFVIHPFLYDILSRAAPAFDSESSYILSFLEKEKRRITRYAAILERLIAPDGSFPAVGRSITYRCGAFSALSHAALHKLLPPALPPEQVRCALGAVIGRTLGAPDSFDETRWLQVGLSGHQPHLGECYISSASCYLSCAVFLPLGLPASDAFWQNPDCDWSWKKIWSGSDATADEAIKD